jgi:hypothetical protein
MRKLALATVIFAGLLSGCVGYVGGGPYRGGYGGGGYYHHHDWR